MKYIEISIYKKLLQDFILPNFNKIQCVALVLFGLQIIFLIATFNRWGPIFTTDTINYFSLGNELGAGKFPYSLGYSPGYPYVVFLFSSIFALNFLDAGFWLCAIFYVCAFFLFYLIIRSFYKTNYSKLSVLLFSLLILNSWAIFKIIFTAHADGLLLLFHLLILLSLLISLKQGSAIVYVISCGVAAVAVWVKYNALIYMPFLALVPLLYYGFKKRALIGLIPVFLSSASFYLFKKMNGVVIHALSQPTGIVNLWNGETSTETMSINLDDTGKVLMGSVISDTIINKIPSIISVAFVILITIGFLIYLFKKLGKLDETLILLFFTFIYTFGILLIYQFNSFIEVNNRTLFPAMISLTLALYSAFIGKQSKFALFLLILIITFQPLRATAGLLDWYNRAPLDSLKRAKLFDLKPSLIRLNEIMNKFQLLPPDVYTNSDRYLRIYFDYQYVGRAPGEIEFQRGKMLPLSQASIKERVEDINSKILNGKAILIMFDIRETQYQEYISDSVLIEKINSDVIIYKKIQ